MNHQKPRFPGHGTIVRMLWMLFLCHIAGCSSRPAAVRPVEINASAAAAEAVNLYDRDGSRTLDDGELAAVPGMAKYKQLYDTDQDKTVSAEEIEARFRTWKDQALGLRELLVVVTLDGKPLADATVRFIPEPYLGPNVKAATGETDHQGVASVSVSLDDLPERFRRLQVRAIMGGTYKVEVTHPTRELPSKYNRETILGEEVALDTVRAMATVELSSR